jgi:hypothetical protein
MCPNAGQDKVSKIFRAIDIGDRYEESVQLVEDTLHNGYVRRLSMGVLPTSRIVSLCLFTSKGDPPPLLKS